MSKLIELFQYIKDLELQCEPNMTIQYIKEIASSESGIASDQLSLIYEGKKLDETGTIESENIPDNCKIFATVVVEA